ncbi:MAG: PilZ domain-containing protein [Pseudomonadota bacterium]
MSISSQHEFGLSDFEAELIPDERRTEPRRITLLQAEIKVSKDSEPVQCVVNDISNSGARVFFDDMPSLPQYVELLIQHPKSNHKCEVRWKNGDEAGLMFIK